MKLLFFNCSKCIVFSTKSTSAHASAILVQQQSIKCGNVMSSHRLLHFPHNFTYYSGIINYSQFFVLSIILKIILA